MGDTAGRIGGLMCLIVMLTADGHSEFLRMVALIIILRPTKTDQRSKVKGVNVRQQKNQNSTQTRSSTVKLTDTTVCLVHTVPVCYDMY